MSGGRRIPATNVRHRLVRMVNGGEMDLDGANALLKSLGVQPLCGGRTVAFRVPAHMRIRYEGAGGTLRTACAAIVDELSMLRWTRFDGCPDGYSLDDLNKPDQAAPRLYTTVYTALRLRVSVRAYERGALETTALGLLAQDLTRLRRLRAGIDQVVPWVDEVVEDVVLDPTHPWLAAR